MRAAAVLIACVLAFGPAFGQASLPVRATDNDSTGSCPAGFTFSDNTLTISGGICTVTTAATAGQSVITDISDDAANESADTSEIATIGAAAATIFSSASDKFTINTDVAWPAATTATSATTATTATTANGLSSGAIDALTDLSATLCGTNELPYDTGAAWSCTAFPPTSGSDCGGVQIIDAGGTCRDLNTDDGTPNEGGDFVSWSKLKNVPAGFADGNDSGSVSCVTVENINAALDDFAFWMAPVAVTITSAWCGCQGTLTTPATIDFADGEGNAMTMTDMTCGDQDSATRPTAQTISAANVLVARESLAFNVTNTPAPTSDKCSICFVYTEN